MSIISAAATSLSLAKDLAKAALGVRDFNEMAPVISQLNDQLLSAQDALFRHQAALLALQQQHFETAEELRKMKIAVAEKGRYTLVQLSEGVLVYKSVNIPPVVGHSENPIPTEPEHYVCQPCFDKGIKVVLQRAASYAAVRHVCSNCQAKYLDHVKERETQSQPRFSTRWPTDY